MDRVLEHTPLLGRSQVDEERQASRSDHVSFFIVSTRRDDRCGYALTGVKPIFLRAAHSPWRPLNQNILGYIRAVVLAYLVATAGMLLNYKIKHREDEHTNWRIPFQFSTVTWVLLIIYHILVTVRSTPLGRGDITTS